MGLETGTTNFRKDNINFSTKQLINNNKNHSRHNCSIYIELNDSYHNATMTHDIVRTIVKGGWGGGGVEVEGGTFQKLSHLGVGWKGTKFFATKGG